MGIQDQGFFFASVQVLFGHVHWDRGLRSDNSPLEPRSSASWHVLNQGQLW